MASNKGGKQIKNTRSQPLTLATLKIDNRMKHDANKEQITCNEERRTSALDEGRIDSRYARWICKMEMHRGKKHWLSCNFSYKITEETHRKQNNLTFQCFFRKSTLGMPWLENSKLTVHQVVLLVKLYLD